MLSRRAAFTEAANRSVRFDEIEKSRDGGRTESTPRALVVATPQPGPESLAANGPGFPVTLDPKVGECRTARRMKELGGPSSRNDHVHPRSAPVLLEVGTSILAGEAGGCADAAAGMRPSFTRVCFQSLRAVLVGSMPAPFHHARSSAVRCASR